MSEEFFKPGNYVNIQQSEYCFAQENITQSVFSIFYQQGTKKIFEEQMIDQTTFKIEKEEPTFIKYDISLKQNENLYQYFAKSSLDNKLKDSNEQFKIFKQQIEFINNMIEPVLNDLGIEYQLFLAGGALRDHLLDRPIKDLDILIEFNDKFQIDQLMGRDSSEKTKKQKEAIEKFFQEKSSMIKKHGLNIFHGQSREKFLHEIIFQTINKRKNIDIQEFFWEDSEKKNKDNPREQTELTPDDSLIYDALFSVLKLNNNEFKYPVDLLLNSNMYSYLSSFDFEICKCSYQFKSIYPDMEQKQSPLFLTPGFIKDVLNSTLSLNIQIFGTEKQVDRCLKDHYLRLKKKYPTHEIELINKTTDSKITQYIEKAHQYYLLEDRLKPKEIKTKTKKI